MPGCSGRAATVTLACSTQRRTVDGRMEKFVLRGDAARACAEPPPSGAARQRLRQTRIPDASKVVVEEMVQHLKDELDDARTTTAMRTVLEVLEAQFISLEMMEKTRIGVSLVRLERRAESEDVKLKAQQLLRQWKVRAKKAMRRRERRVQTYGRTLAE